MMIPHLKGMQAVYMCSICSDQQRVLFSLSHSLILTLFLLDYVTLPLCKKWSQIVITPRMTHYPSTLYIFLFLMMISISFLHQTLVQSSITKLQAPQDEHSHKREQQHNKALPSLHKVWKPLGMFTTPQISSSGALWCCVGLCIMFILQSTTTLFCTTRAVYPYKHVEYTFEYVSKTYSQHWAEAQQSQATQQLYSVNLAKSNQSSKHYNSHLPIYSKCSLNILLYYIIIGSVCADL